MTDFILQLLNWGFPSGCIGVAIGWFFNRKAHNAEAAKKVHDIYKQMYDDVSAKLLEMQKENGKLQELVEKAWEESSELRRAVNRLTRALSRAKSCLYSDDCPVIDELRNNEEINRGIRPKVRTGQHRRSRSRNQQNTADGTDVGGEAADSDGQPP